MFFSVCCKSLDFLLAVDLNQEEKDGELSEEIADR